MLTKLICGIRGIAGAEARPDLIGLIGTTEVMPCYKTLEVTVFDQAEGPEDPCSLRDRALHEIAPHLLVEVWGNLLLIFLFRGG